MPFFIRVPTAAAAAESSTYLSAACRDHAGPCVHGVPATPAELLDNSGKGCECRFDAVAVSNEPPRFAFYSQALGVPNWLSYDAAADRLGFSRSLGPESTFSVEAVGGASSRTRAIFNPHHGVYLTARAEGGVCCMHGERELTPMAHLAFETAPGSGPLMPGRRYFIKSIFGTLVGVDAQGRLCQRHSSAAGYDDGGCVEFTAEEGHRGPHTPSNVHCYRLRTSGGRFVAMSAAGELYLAGPEKALSPETSFQLAPDSVIVGNHRIVDNVRFRCVRADADGSTLSVASAVQRKACDTFGFQAVEAGPDGDGMRAGARSGPVWPVVCSREHAAARMGPDRVPAATVAAAAATGRIGAAPAVPYPCAPARASHTASQPSRWASEDWPAKAAAGESAVLVPSSEAADDEAPARRCVFTVDLGSCASRRCAVLALLAVILCAAVVVVHFTLGRGDGARLRLLPFV